MKSIAIPEYTHTLHSKRETKQHTLMGIYFAYKYDGCQKTLNNKPNITHDEGT